MEDRDTIGQLESEWNDFDIRTPKTRMLHVTHRRTQPWKARSSRPFAPVSRDDARPAHLFGEYDLPGNYK